MNGKVLFCAVAAFLPILFYAGCSSDDYTSPASAGVTDDDAGTVDVQSFTDSVGDTADTYDPDDIVSGITFSHDVALDFNNECVQIDSGASQSLGSSPVTLLTTDSGSLTVTWTDDGIKVESAVESNVRYTLTGTLGDTLIFESVNPYELYLNGMDISGSEGPALDLESSEKVYIVTADGSENSLSDDSERSDDMDMKAALYGKGPMIFSGGGMLTVKGSFKHGIYSKDYIRIREGEINVNVDARDAVRTKNGFIFDDGTLTVSATGDGIDEESKGIKVEGTEDNPGEGFIAVNGGTIDIASVSKGMTASWDVDDDAESTDTSDDPDPFVQINSGVISIVTTGASYETTVDGEEVSCSPEGIEGKSRVEINSGYITIETADDCLNAGDLIEINGGYLYAVSSDNDAIDSNGTLTVSGGVVVAIGDGAPEGSFDCDNNTFTITGGTLVGIGGSYSTPTASACTQNTVLLGSGSKDDTLGLVSSGGETVFAYSIPSDYSKMILSCSGIETGSTYVIYEGGSGGGDDSFYGLYLENLSYSGGMAQDSFTVSSSVTAAGSSSPVP